MSDATFNEAKNAFDFTAKILGGEYKIPIVEASEKSKEISRKLNADVEALSDKYLAGIAIGFLAQQKNIFQLATMAKITTKTAAVMDSIEAIEDRNADVTTAILPVVIDAFNLPNHQSNEIFKLIVNAVQEEENLTRKSLVDTLKALLPHKDAIVQAFGKE